MSEEEINISPMMKIGMLFLIGLVVGFSIVNLFYEKNETKEDKITYLEEILFNQTNPELSSILAYGMTLKGAKIIYKKTFTLISKS